MYIRPQYTDHLGRVIPAITVADVVSGTPTPREVAECLAIAAQHGQYDAYDALATWALSHGITHGPADLAGHRCRFTPSSGRGTTPTNQALVILDALDACPAGESLLSAIGRDCDGVAFVRTPDGAVHRGASMRDALAQFVQSRVA